MSDWYWPIDEERERVGKKAVANAYKEMSGYEREDEDATIRKILKAFVASANTERDEEAKMEKKHRMGCNFDLDHRHIVASAFYAKTSGINPKDLHPYAIISQELVIFARACIALKSFDDYRRSIEYDQQCGTYSADELLAVLDEPKEGG